MAAGSLKVKREAAPIRKQTADNLRAAILEGRFMPGQRLNEKELCELTGVSRTSVREALRQLEAESLVTTLPNKGPVVTRITCEEAQGIYEVREQLEGLAVRLFAERADDAQVMALGVEVARLESASQADDITAYLKAKGQFYEVLLLGCGNKTVYSILGSLLARVNLLRTTSLSTPNRMGKSAMEIKKIMEAIQRRDAQAAYEACIEHVCNAAASALPVLQGQSKAN